MYLSEHDRTMAQLCLSLAAINLEASIEDVDLTKERLTKTLAEVKKAASLLNPKPRHQCRRCGNWQDEAFRDGVNLCEPCKARPELGQVVHINALDPFDPCHAREEATFDRRRDLDERGISTEQAYSDEHPMQGSGR